MTNESWCPNHPGFPAAGTCAGCRLPFCGQCLETVDGYPLCEPCKVAHLDRARPAGSAAGPPTVADQIIPVKNPYAMTAYYVSVFSLIPCAGLLLGPAALILAAKGSKARKENPHLPGQAHITVANVLGALTTLLNLTAFGWLLYTIILHRTSS